MNNFFQHIKGDKTIWAIVAVLALLSFLPVYSASTNLVYVVGNGSTFGHLSKHALLLILGFGIIYGVHKIPYKYFSGGSQLMLPIIFILLMLTLAQGTTIGGANASRWLSIPFVPMKFQTSTLAGVVLMIYTARYLAKNKELTIDFKESLLRFWLPVVLILGLILPANLSTTAIIVIMILLLLFLGGYPIKFLFRVMGMGVLLLGFLFILGKAFPETMPSRFNTWRNRIENFSSSEGEEGYQVEKAKIAIASGVGIGKGFGKSVQKNFLPQSSSDFIYAIIIEETGMLGGVFIIFLYLLLLFRIVIAAKKATTIFGMLLVCAVGLPIIFQAVINMGVAVNLFPVTGQTLPLVSSGGTSIWMTCFSLGIILSVTASKNENEETILDDNPLTILHETID